ncbi:MAG: YfhO family protein [Chloroflexi bacterium]|nr:YfhO family protein [Chloroflexota bacterium]
MGAPFLANSQAGVFYPLNWPLIFFTAPVAVKITLVVHLIIAAWGAYALARRACQLEPTPAAFAAALFALGGYLTAQVEHVNQLQGLAWMPLTLLAAHQIFHSPRSRAPMVHCSLFHCSLFIVSLSLQLTAGHTQTAFITLTACAGVALQSLIQNTPYPISRRLLGIGYWVLGILFAFLLSAPQLLPTLELSRLSLRGGGLPLNEAVSFSLNPLLLGRALLPGYGRLIFSEFVGYIGIVPLALALLSLPHLRRAPQLWLAAWLATLGLFFALGGYNPVYLVLARFAPGFDLFRVPARWLALWALGVSMLAGYGLQKASNLKLQTSNLNLAFLSLSPILLISLTFLSSHITPPGELGPIGLPTALDLALWLAPLAILFILLITRRAHRAIVLALAGAELLIASQALPLNHLTTPQAYSGIRPAMTQLLAANADPTPSTVEVPPARFLSLSALEFDPGDLAELHSALDPQLPPDGVYDAIIAAKYKEVLSPNLSLTWGIPAVDGYDGGILPLRQYADFAAAFGPVPHNTDGRLRQILTTVPPNWLLNLTNTRWIITDKTGDAWIDNIFYDLQFAVDIDSTHPLTIARLPEFESTAVGLIVADTQNPAATGAAHLTLADGTSLSLPIAPEPAQTALRLRLPRPAVITALTLTADSTLTVRGAGLIDERADAFQSLTLGPYRLAHSGDVKIYENLNVLPRAFIASDVMLSADGAKHLKAETLRASGAQGDNVSVIKYEAERVVIQTTTDTPGYLVLTDEYYPGWLATVDGQPAAITRAYGLFRAVAVAPGTHTVEFRFEPLSFKFGAIVSALTLITLAALFTIHRSSFIVHPSSFTLHPS